MSCTKLKCQYSSIILSSVIASDAVCDAVGVSNYVFPSAIVYLFQANYEAISLW